MCSRRERGAGCVAYGGLDESSIFQYLGWGGNTQASAEMIFDRWSDERGIEVRHVSAAGDDEMLSYLQEHPRRRRPSDPYGVTVGRELGLIADVDYDEVPNFRESLLLRGGTDRTFNLMRSSAMPSRRGLR